MNKTVFAWLLVAGGLCRLVLLPLPGTIDVDDFKVWTFHAATRGPSQVYRDSSDPESRVLTFGDLSSRVDYPPVALYELALAGRVYRTLFPQFPDSGALTASIKALPQLASAGLTLLIFVTVQRRQGPECARLCALLYWINPAVMLHGPVLGYIGALAFLPAVGALMAAVNGRAWLSGALLAIAVLTKPQGIFVAPALLLALACDRRAGTQLTRAAAGALIATAVVLTPILAAGALFELGRALAALVTDQILSATAANIWWVAGYLIRVARRIEASGLTALTIEGRTFMLSEIVDLGPWSWFGRSIGALSLIACSWLAVGAVVAWGGRQARQSMTFIALVGLAALTVHTYFLVAVQVHENHLSLALPLVALIATERRAYLALLVALSAVVRLNLNLFYGFGEGVGYALPRSATVVDASVLLAIANIGVWIWHTRLFAREASAAPSATAMTHQLPKVRRDAAAPRALA